MIKPSGGEDRAYKTLRNSHTTYDECTKILSSPAPPQQVAEDGEVASSQEAKAEEGVAQEDPLPGYWVKLNKKDWAFVFTARPCSGDATTGNDDEDEDETATQISLKSKSDKNNFDQDLNAKLTAINLTTIASGVTTLGHRRARLKQKREIWQTSGTPQEKAAAPACTLRLSLAGDAEEVSKAEVLHTMDWPVLEMKMTDLTTPTRGGEMIVPVSLAVELDNKHSCQLGAEAIKGTDQALDQFLTVTVPCKLTDLDADPETENMQGVDEEEYNWRNPMSRLVPGKPADIAKRFESAMYSYLFVPLVRAWTSDAEGTRLMLFADLGENVA